MAVINKTSLCGLLQVTVFHPGDRGKGVAVSDCPPLPLSACKTFTFESLPAKYFKKYQYAVRCVMLTYVCGIGHWPSSLSFFMTAMTSSSLPLFFIDGGLASSEGVYGERHA